MAVYFASLNSGSNGNCYYVGDSSHAVLIDAGIPCREVEARMYRLGLDCSRLRAIFISHEHSDHIAGLSALAEKLDIPVYITAATLRGSGIRLRQQHIALLDAATAVHIGALCIRAFPKFHDACDPHSFMVTAHGVSVGVFTDIGIPCDQLVHHFRQCHAAFLESNYDEAMLMNGRYPWFLKNRIRGGLGHLSNAQAVDVFRSHRPAFMTHLLLSHLSRENNRPELVRELFHGIHANVLVDIASRHHESPVFQIDACAPVPVNPFVSPSPAIDLAVRGRSKRRDTPISQLSLF